MSDQTIEASPADSDANYLLSEKNYMYKEYLDELKYFIMSEKFDPEQNLTAPRFEYMSFVIKNMMLIPYDNEKLFQAFGSRNVPQTAFTDFQNIWVHVDFLEAIIKADQAENKMGACYLILHEASHNAFSHNLRLKEFPHQVANWGEDMMINLGLNEKYGTEVPACSVLNCGVGFLPEDITTYGQMSDYDIVASKMKELQEQLDEMMKNGQPQPGGKPGQKGQPGDGSGEGEPGDGSGQPGKGQGQPGKGKPGQSGGGGGPTIQDLIDALQGDQSGQGGHTNGDVQDLVDALNEAGLGDYVDSLELPKNEDEAKSRDEKISGQLISSIQEADQHYRENGLREPGGHMNDYMRTMIKEIKQPKASWKMRLTKAIHGVGQARKYTPDTPHNIYYVDAKPLGVGNQIYTGSMMPAKKSGVALVGIDTSGSMSVDNIGDALGAVFELASGNKMRGDTPTILVYNMDTILRGEPMVVTKENWKQVLGDYKAGRKGVDGRGGTDLANGINGIIAAEATKKAVKRFGKVKAVICITDLGDRAPQREDFPNTVPTNMTYLAVPGTYSDAFAAKVKNYAQVINMGAKKLNIDLEKTTVKKNGMSF